MKQFIDIVNAYCSNISLFIFTALVISFVLAIIHKRYKYLTGVLFIITAWIGVLIYAAGGDITVFFFILLPFIGIRAYRAYLLCKPDPKPKDEDNYFKYKVWLVAIALMFLTRVSEAQVFTSFDRNSEMTVVQQDFMDIVDDVTMYQIGKRFSISDQWQSMTPYDKSESDDYITYSYNINSTMVIFVMVDDRDIVVSISVKGTNDDYSEQLTALMFSNKWRVTMRQVNNTREGEDGYLYAKSKQGPVYVYRDMHGYFRVSLYPN